MDCITKLLQEEIKEAMDLFETTLYLAKEAYDSYWDTDANTKVTAASAASQVLVSPQVAKEDYANALTLCENLWKFFNNTALGAVDHEAYANLFSHGKYYASPLAAEISPATGSIGATAKTVCDNCISLLEKSRQIDEMYTSNEISDCVAVMDAHRIMYGSEMTVSDLSSAITMCQEFVKFMTSVDPTEAEYITTLNQWKLY